MALVDDIRMIKRTLLGVVIVALCITALIAIVAVVSASFDDTEGRVLLTHVAVAAYSLLALAAAAVGRRMPLLAQAGFATCAVGVVLAVIVIWSDSAGDSVWRAAGVALVASFTIAHGALIESRRRESDGRGVRAISMAAVGAGVTLGATLGTGIAVASDVSDAYLRALGVLAVLDLLATAVLPIARKIEHASPD
jgi:hypothetical protein